MHLETILDGCSFILSAAICVLVGHTIFMIIELYQEQHHPSETCKRLNPLVLPERNFSTHFAAVGLGGRWLLQAAEPVVRFRYCHVDLGVCIVM
jgi:hypothetical protein